MSDLTSTLEEHEHVPLARIGGGIGFIALAIVVFAAGCGGAGAPAASGCRNWTQARTLNFGVNVHPVWSDGDVWSALLDRVVALGADHIRLDVGWNDVQPKGPGSYDLSYLQRLDAQLDQAKARGLGVIVVFLATPDWANGGAGSLVPPTDDQRFADVLAWLAARERTRVDAWELWNEPNSRQFFVGTPATYVHLFTAGAAAVRRADPDAMVMSGGLSGNDSAWLNAAYQAGLGGQADAIAVHPYPSPSDLAPQEGSSNDPHRFPALASVRQVMDRNGDGQVPIWLTEIGWSVHDNPSGTAAWARGVTATRQASLVTSLVQVTTADDPSVIGITWYNARDRAVGSVQERHFGLLQRNLVPRPATDAFHAAVARARTSYAPSAARAQSLAGFPHRPTTAGVCR